MSILALDVGFRNTGWAVLDKRGDLVAFGCIETSPDNEKRVRIADDNAQRAAYIALRLDEIIKEHEVSVVVGELPSSGGKSGKAMTQMGIATGTVAATLALLKIPVAWVSPTDVKLAITGKKTATKNEIMNAVKDEYVSARFPSKNQFEHIADAIGAFKAYRNKVMV